MSLEITNNASRVLLEIWRQLDFAVGLPSEWPDSDNLRERSGQETEFLRVPLHQDAIRLTEQAIDQSSVPDPNLFSQRLCSSSFSGEQLSPNFYNSEEKAYT